MAEAAAPASARFRTVVLAVGGFAAILVAMNGDRRIGRWSPSIARQFVQGDSEYTLSLERLLQTAVARAPAVRYGQVSDLVAGVLPALRAFPPRPSNSEEPTRMA
jgi:hypothetical protein